MKRLIKAKEQIIQASHLFVSDPKVKRILSSDLFEFLNTAYKWIGGFKSFDDEEDFVDRSYLWYITYEGPLPSNESDIDINKVYTVSVFKQKYGLKLVGIGNNRFKNIPKEERMEYKFRAKDALIDQIQFSVKKGWAEVSGSAEAMFKLALSPKCIIDPKDLKTKIPEYKDIEILPDNIHYLRTLRDGTEVTKVAYGTIRL